MSRDLLARRALDDVAKILTLQDRNPHSPTYGCFDRNYWHYRIIDFPSGKQYVLKNMTTNNLLGRISEASNLDERIIIKCQWYELVRRPARTGPR